MPENEQEPEQQPAPVRSMSLIRVSILMTASFVAGVLVATLIPALPGYREAYRLSRCAKNLRQFGLVFYMHANDHRSLFPPPSRVPGKFFPNWEDVYPDYLGHKNIDYPGIVACPSDVTVPSGEYIVTERGAIWDDHSYIYFGYDIADEGQGFAFLEAYEQKVTEAIHSGNLAFDKQLEEWLLPESFWELTLYVGENRGYEGRDYLVRSNVGRGQFDVIHRNYVPPRPAYLSFVVMFDRPGAVATDFNHVPGGSNILFLDGHVEFKTYPSEEFVLTPAFIEKFLETEARVEKLYADFVSAQEK